LTAIDKALFISLTARSIANIMIQQTNHPNQPLVKHAIEILSLTPANDAALVATLEIKYEVAQKQIKRLRFERARLMGYIRQLESEAEFATRTLRKTDAVLKRLEAPDMVANALNPTLPAQKYIDRLPLSVRNAFYELMEQIDAALIYATFESEDEVQA
jgi:septal ring factor EnvC (AmiA/AmiB activator)